MKVLYFIYQWLIAYPLAIGATIVTAVLTIILSPAFPNHKLAYFPARAWGKFVCWVFLIRVKFVNTHLIRPNVSYVIIANHESMFDILAIYGWLTLIFKWIMKAELRKVPAIGPACAAAGHIFIDRSNPVNAKLSLDKAEAQLKNGVSVVIFPEGTRTKTGKMGPFKKGAFKIAQDINLPILPVAIKGSFERVKNGGLFIFPGKITLSVCPEINPTQYENQKDLINSAFEAISNQLKVK